MFKRRGITLLIIVIGLGALLLTQWLVPALALGAHQWIRIIYLMCFLALISGGIYGRRHITGSQVLTYSGIWAIIILSLMIGYRLFKTMAIH